MNLFVLFSLWISSYPRTCWRLRPPRFGDPSAAQVNKVRPLRFATLGSHTRHNDASVFVIRDEASRVVSRVAGKSTNTWPNQPSPLLFIYPVFITTSLQQCSNSFCTANIFLHTSSESLVSQFVLVNHTPQLSVIHLLLSNILKKKKKRHEKIGIWY